jgi:DNA-binding LacI/PurR family transcriptional regulator
MSGINVTLSNRRQQVLINQAEQTVRRLGDLLDVDTTNKVDGAIIVYNALTQNFEASLVLNNQTIDGGSY